MAKAAVFLCCAAFAMGVIWTAPCPSASLPDPVVAEDLQASLEEAVQACLVPGAVAAIEWPGGEVWRGAAGLADVGAAAPMNVDMHFHIGSLTKSFTATVILQLSEKGLLALDDTVEEWLPGQLVRGADITLRDLLQMRSGLGHYEQNQTWGEKFEADPGYKWSPAELVSFSDNTLAEPGQVFDYNNVNYIILGVVIEKASGIAYGEAVGRSVLDPLGLNESSVPSDSAMPESYAHGYLNSGGAATDHSGTWDPSVFGPAGSMISTADDMLAWCDAFMAGRLLSSKSYGEQFNMIPIENTAGSGYGFAVGRNGSMVGHSGNYNGLYTAAMYWIDGYKYVVLANGQAAGGGEGSQASAIMRKLADLVGALN